jgi:hypothetical protein
MGGFTGEVPVFYVTACHCGGCRGFRRWNWCYRIDRYQRGIIDAIEI